MDESRFYDEPYDPEEDARHSREYWQWRVRELNRLLTPELIYDTAVFMRCQLNLGKDQAVWELNARYSYGA